MMLKATNPATSSESATRPLVVFQTPHRSREVEKCSDYFLLVTYSASLVLVFLVPPGLPIAEVVPTRKYAH